MITFTEPEKKRLIDMAFPPKNSNIIPKELSLGDLIQAVWAIQAENKIQIILENEGIFIGLIGKFSNEFDTKNFKYKNYPNETEALKACLKYYLENEK